MENDINKKADDLVAKISLSVLQLKQIICLQLSYKGILIEPKDIIVGYSRDSGDVFFDGFSFEYSIKF